MEMMIRPMTPQERNYSYSQSQQITMQAGCIGHLRADFGSNGLGFYTSWDDHRADLKNDAFKVEFDDVINDLRKDGNILCDRNTLSRCCYAAPASEFHNDRNEFGFRVDTDHYSYMLRLNPNMGDYNLYCYCYLRQWLDRHLKQADRGIRFITPDYKEVFRIPDGDKIRITTPGGETMERTCRYIDDYHVEVGNNLYHICEFAERMEQCGNQVMPLRSSLPDMCYSTVPSSGELIIIKHGASGNYHCEFSTDDRAYNREFADDRNVKLGVGKAQEAAMLAGSMFGWENPAADPKNYDEHGVAIPPKQRDRGEAR